MPISEKTKNNNKVIGFCNVSEGLINFLGKLSKLRKMTKFKKLLKSENSPKFDIKKTFGTKKIFNYLRLAFSKAFILRYFN